MRGLRSKQILQFLAILSIIIVSVVLLFFPNLIEDRYPYSYPRVNEGKENVESLNRELRSNESMIENNIIILAETEVKEEEIAEKEFNIRKGIIEEDFELHIPSILIKLEQKAIDNNLDLVIDYNSMTTDTDSGSSEYLTEEHYQAFDESERGNPNEHSDEDNFSGGQVFAQESEEQNGISITENIDENNNDDETTEQENSEHNDRQENPDDEFDRHKQTLPAIEGINVTTIPLGISGSFYNVRNYIRFLDEVGMIEPSSVIIASEGRNISASIVINIFHGEVN